MPYLFSLLPSLLLAGLACWVGVLLSGRIWADASLKTRLCFGTVIGLTGLSWLGFLLALVGGLNWLTIGITATVFMVAPFFLRPFALPLPRPVISIPSIAYYLAWLVFFTWLFSRVIVIEGNGLYTSPANNYGDLAFHFSVVTSFADGDNFPPRNPIFDGLKFTYPFLIDFLAAFFHRAGADWAAAFFLPNLLLSLALVGLIELLTEQLTQSRLATRLAPVLFFLSGGTGFLYGLRDWYQSDASWWEFLWHLPRSYTKNDELDLQWGNMLTTLVVPQRSLLLGVPVFAMIVLLWWQWLHHRDEREIGGVGEGEIGGSKNLSSSPHPPLSHSPHQRLGDGRNFLFAAGVLAGLMPLLHAHGFFSVMMVSAAMALVFFSWDWLAFFVPVGVLSLPQAWWLSGTGTRSSLFKPHLGWATGDNFAKFLALNFGLFLLVLVIAFFFQSARTRRFYLPFLLCFIVPNVVLLAPWPWDNIKVLLYWYLLSCPLVAALLARLFTGRVIVWPLPVLLFLSLIASGGLDVLRALSPVEKMRLFDAEQLQVAARIKERVPPHSLVLSAPIHNSVLALSGRQMLMGYPGHLWSHGIQFEDRERDVKAIYRGGAEAERLLRQYGIDYVVIGPIEFSELNADEGYFAAKYDAVIDEAGYRVYRINPTAKN
ncbi:MAG TPA: hypothetical protein VFZ34_16445 [Blastocatellia bacterium]|nr:hypothetical protein [Blastocatellia bacterium]